MTRSHCISRLARLGTGVLVCVLSLSGANRAHAQGPPSGPEIGMITTLSNQVRLIESRIAALALAAGASAVPSNLRELCPSTTSLSQFGCNPMQDSECRTRVLRQDLSALVGFLELLRSPGLAEGTPAARTAARMLAERISRNSMLIGVLSDPATAASSGLDRFIIGREGGPTDPAGSCMLTVVQTGPGLLTFGAPPARTNGTTNEFVLTASRVLAALYVLQGLGAGSERCLQESACRFNQDVIRALQSGAPRPPLPPGGLVPAPSGPGFVSPFDVHFSEFLRLLFRNGNMVWL